MRWRKRTTPPAEDEFLRALETRASTGDDDPHEDRSPAADVTTGPHDRDGYAEDLARALSEAEARAASAEAALADVRDEAERRLADARAAIEREREERTAAQRRVEQGREELARRLAEFDERERDLSEQLAQAERHQDLDRRRDLSEEETDMRERWQRWEADAQREAERRATELAEAERRIAEARAALDAVRAASGRSAAPPQPATTGRPRGRVRRLLGRRSGRPDACAICARAFPRDGNAAASGWERGLRGTAICPQCQSEGWHFPDGRLLPVRSAPVTPP